MNPTPQPAHCSFSAKRSPSPWEVSDRWKASSPQSSLAPQYFAASSPFFRAPAPTPSNLAIPAAARELGASFIVSKDATSPNIAKPIQRSTPRVPCARVFESASVMIRHGRNASWHEGREAVVGAEHNLYPGVFIPEFVDEREVDANRHLQAGCYDLFEHAAQGNLQLFKGKR